MHHRASRGGGGTWRRVEHALTAAPLAWHVTLRPQDERLLVKNAADLRCVARVVIEQGEHRGLLASGTADDHVHALLATHRDAVGRFAHDVETSLGWRLGLLTPFEPARIRPVTSQPHLVSSFWYGIDQAKRHGLAIDPCYDGTCLPDILGARVMLDVGASSMGAAHREPRLLGTTIGTRVAALLPRIRGRDLLALLGGPSMLEASLDLAQLRGAVAAAVGLADLDRHGAALAAAIRAAAHVAADVGATRLGSLLGVSPRWIQLQRRQQPIPQVARAIGIQWRLRSWLWSRPPIAPLLIGAPAANVGTP